MPERGKIERGSLFEASWVPNHRVGSSCTVRSMPRAYRSDASGGYSASDGDLRSLDHDARIAQHMTLAVEHPARGDDDAFT